MPLMMRSAKALLVALVQVSDSWAEPGRAAASSRPAGQCGRGGGGAAQVPGQHQLRSAAAMQAGAVCFAS